MRAATSACAAFRLARALTDGELFVLMASQHVTKRGQTLRVFCEEDLARLRIARPLASTGGTVRECLAGLARKGFIAPRGRRCFAASREGNLVKHVFNALDVELGMASGGLMPARTVERIAHLRAEMRAICATARRNSVDDDPSSLGAFQGGL